MPARLLITGGSGLLGSHLLSAAQSQYETFATFFSRPFAGGLLLDIRDAEAVHRLFEQVRPDYVVHTAYGKAQGDWRAVITDGSAHVAHAARRYEARLVHLSTDVIFSGQRGNYREEDTPDPITDYGQAKYEAERLVAAHAPDALLVRTSLIYSLDGRDPHSKFVLDGVRRGQPVTLFTDEYRNPIYIVELAQALLELLRIAVRGPLHVASAERLNRYAFGLAIARYHGVPTDCLVPTTPDTLGMTRPKDCSLNSQRAQSLLRTRLRGVSEVLTG